MLNADNVSEILEISYELNLEDIKASGFKFVWDNLEEVCKTASFKNLLKIEPGLMVDILLMSKKLTTALSEGNCIFWKYSGDLNNTFVVYMLPQISLWYSLY